MNKLLLIGALIACLSSCNVKENPQETPKVDGPYISVSEILSWKMWKPDAGNYVGIHLDLAPEVSSRLQGIDPGISTPEEQMKMTLVKGSESLTMNWLSPIDSRSIGPYDFTYTGVDSGHVFVWEQEGYLDSILKFLQDVPKKE